MVEGNYEVGGIVPLGAAYPVVNDRKFNTVEALAGKRIAAFDYDKAQAVMIQRIGAQPACRPTSPTSRPSSTTVRSTWLARHPWLTSRWNCTGIGKNGGIVRFPMLILTYQIMLNKTKFPRVLVASRVNAGRPG